MSNYMIEGDKLEFYNNFPIFMSLIYKLISNNVEFWESSLLV